MTPITTCPDCGAPLSAVNVQVHPDSPPWVCANCKFAFWNAELSAQARQARRTQFRDWGDQTQAILASAEAEHQAQLQQLGVVQ